MVPLIMQAMHDTHDHVPVVSLTLSEGSHGKAETRLQNNNDNDKSMARQSRAKQSEGANSACMLPALMAKKDERSNKIRLSGPARMKLKEGPTSIIALDLAGLNSCKMS